MFPAPFAAFLDACVLYPFTLRDTLLRCAERDLYQPYWSAEVLDEMTRNLVGRRMTNEQAEHLVSEMSAAFPAALVEDYDHLTPAMRNNEKDRHVTAAAVKAGACVIVSSNVRDFKDLPEGFEVQSPDEFLCHLYDLEPETMLSILHEQAADLRKGTYTAADIAKALEAVAPNFTATLLAALQGSQV